MQTHLCLTKADSYKSSFFFCAVVGLRLLGQKMIDPYGNDYEDLSVITFVTTCLDISRICLSSHDQGPVNKDLERNLLKRHNDIAKGVKID